jgi:hypothetical protein
VSVAMALPVLVEISGAKGEKKRGRGRPRKNETRLAVWLDTHREEVGDRYKVADFLGVHRDHLDRILRGDSRPSPVLAYKIESMTKGEITARELLIRPAPQPSL